jgi:hypothetical protein
MIGLAFALLLAQAGIATPTNNAGPQAQAADDKIVCKLQATWAGTKIPERICRTHAEWEQIYKEAQEDMNSSRNKTLGCNPSDGRLGC